MWCSYGGVPLFCQICGKRAEPFAAAEPQNAERHFTHIFTINSQTDYRQRHLNYKNKKGSQGDRNEPQGNQVHSNGTADVAAGPENTGDGGVIKRAAGKLKQIKKTHPACG